MRNSNTELAVLAEYFPEFKTFSVNDWDKWTNDNIHGYVTDGPIAGHSPESFLYATALNLGSSIADQLKDARIVYLDEESTRLRDEARYNDAVQFIDEHLMPLLPPLSPAEERATRNRAVDMAAFIRGEHNRIESILSRRTERLKGSLETARHNYLADKSKAADVTSAPVERKEPSSTFMATAHTAKSELHKYIPLSVHVPPEVNVQQVINYIRHELSVDAVPDWGTTSISHELLAAVNHAYHNYIGAKDMNVIESTIVKYFPEYPNYSNATWASWTASNIHGYITGSDLVDPDAFVDGIIHHMGALAANAVKDARTLYERSNPKSVIHSGLAELANEMPGYDVNLIPLHLDHGKMLQLVRNELKGKEREEFVAYIVDTCNADLIDALRDIIPMPHTAMSVLQEPKCEQGKRNMVVNYYSELICENSKLSGTITLSIDGELAIAHVSVSKDDKNNDRVKTTWATVPNKGYDTTLNSIVRWVENKAAAAIIVTVFRDDGAVSTSTHVLNI